MEGFVCFADVCDRYKKGVLHAAKMVSVQPEGLPGNLVAATGNGVLTWNSKIGDVDRSFSFSRLGVFSGSKSSRSFSVFFFKGEKHSHFSQEHVNGAFQLVTKDWAGGLGGT